MLIYIISIILCTSDHDKGTGYLKHLRVILLLLALILSVPEAVPAEGTWYSFGEKDVPEDLGWMLTDYSGTVTLTFLGDCTLGGEKKYRNAGRGFVRTVEQYGYAWPLQGLTRLTATDDITVANLEGVLSDRDLPPEDKEFNFIGRTAYTEILTLGSVECVTLANNHSRDYGNAGYADTEDALDRAGVAHFGTEEMAVWKNQEGLTVGFLGVSGSLSGDRGKRYDRQMAILKDLGCAAVITVMHAGEEYSDGPDSYQIQIRDRAIAMGTDLIVGHHPHVAQGVEVKDGVPVVYSLGNCSFGGNGKPKDYDALVLRAELRFEDGELTGCELYFYPVRISSHADFNDYSPVLLQGVEAEQALSRLTRRTGTVFGPFDDEKGASVR